MSLGDASDVKRALRRMLEGPGFTAAVSSAVIEKGDGVWPVLPPTVYENERLTDVTFPMAELIVYQSTFSDDDVVKRTEHRIGVRWTAVGDNEQTVTKNVELLVRATTDLVWMSNLDTLVASGPIRVESEDYSPLHPTLRPFMKSGLVIMIVPVWRD